MEEPSEIQQARADELPRSAVSDPPLGLDTRTQGRRGVGRKLAFAALAVVLLIVMVAVALVFSHFSRQGDLSRPASEIQTR